MNILKTLLLIKSPSGKRKRVKKTVVVESPVVVEARRRAAEILKLNDIRRKLRSEVDHV